MDNTLARLIDVEHLDAARGRFDPQSRQQVLTDLDGAGASARRRNRMVRRCERQFRIMDAEIAAFEIKKSARAAEVMQQVTVDMEEIGIIAHPSDDMLVPDFGQQRTTCLFQRLILPLSFDFRRHPPPMPFATACSAASKHSRLWSG